MTPLVFDDAAVVRGHDADALGGVDRAAAADRDQAVAALRSILGGPGVDELDARVGADAIEDDRLAVRAAQDLERGVEQTRGLHARVGDEQRPPDAKQAGLGPELADGAQALHETGWALVSAKGVFQHGLEEGASALARGGHNAAIQPEFRGGYVPGRCPAGSGKSAPRRR